MRTITEQELEEMLKEIAGQGDELLYRGLGYEAEAEYRTGKDLEPRWGSISVGKGIFFTNSLDYAISFAKNIILITTRKTLDSEGKAIDTRQKGHEKEAEEKLDRELGKGNYTDYRLWEEIQKSDTITYEGGPEQNYVYTKRGSLAREKIIAEIIIQKEIENAA